VLSLDEPRPSVRYTFWVRGHRLIEARPATDADPRGGSWPAGGDEVAAAVELVAGPDEHVLGDADVAQGALGELVARSDAPTTTIRS